MDYVSKNRLSTLLLYCKITIIFARQQSQGRVQRGERRAIAVKSLQHFQNIKSKT